jgi:hypothetical protein
MLNIWALCFYLPAQRLYCGIGGNKREKDLVVYISTPRWQPKKLAGEPRLIWGPVMVRRDTLVFFLQVPLAGCFCSDIDVSHTMILLRFCGVPKFKAGNTDVATAFEVCICVV